MPEVRHCTDVQVAYVDVTGGVWPLQNRFLYCGGTEHPLKLIAPWCSDNRILLYYSFVRSLLSECCCGGYWARDKAARQRRESGDWELLCISKALRQQTASDGVLQFSAGAF